MSISADVVRTHIDYTAWASRRLVGEAAQLSPEQLERDFGTADRSVLGTLVHIFAADRLWLGRLTGASRSTFVTDNDRSLEVLQRDWPALGECWKGWARGLSDEDVRATIVYTDLKGNEWRQPVWQLVLHAVNHATHHRGQVAGFLRSMGRTPPSTDLVRYYRELG